MKLLEMTLSTIAENLALDQALLDEAEDAGLPSEILRIWEPTAPAVVIGRASRLEQEIDLAACRRLGVSVARRDSGGAAIVAGPGCLMYAVVLSYELRPQLLMIDAAHQFVLDRLCTGLRPHCPDIGHRGQSDLALTSAAGEEKKVSGNSLRCRRNHLLYHGTMLYDFSLGIVGECLRTPPRQPDYRERRPHGEFITNIPLSRDTLHDALLDAWKRPEPSDAWPQERTEQLVAERYGADEWTFRR